MIETGKLTVRLKCAAANVQAVEIQSSRPLHVSRLFLGKTPAQTLTLLPLLFNVCGVAQAFAAVSVFSQALGVAENPSVTLARQLLLNVEIVREHAWWLLFQDDKSKLAPFIQFVKQFKQALFVNGEAFSLNSQLQPDHSQLHPLINQLEQQLDDIFAGQRLNWLALKNTDDLQHWLIKNASFPALLLRELFEQHYQNLACTQLRLLTTLPTAQLQQQLNSSEADNFIRFPTWQGECHETGCLNRQQYHPLIANLLQHYGNSLLTRLVSRLVELANLPNLIRQNLADLTTMPLLKSSSFSSSQVGLAQIQASRGLLIHRVALKNGLVANYQIVAPTEWNFHPQGVAALGLQQLTATNKTLLQQQAALVIKAIDPCVTFEVLIEE